MGQGKGMTALFISKVDSFVSDSRECQRVGGSSTWLRQRQVLLNDSLGFEIEP